MDHHQQSRKQMASPEVALANEVFDQFCNAATLKSILGHFRHLCDLLKIKPTNFHQFYPKLKSKLRSWKAQALWKKFDQRANHKCYNRGKACLNTRVLIIGGGPCGMRSAIEAQLLGAKVVVVEKRDRMSRNNVLHLWPFVIQDLRALGAKKFFGKFCAGSIDHISIRQLQCILLKVALLLGVEFHESVSFEALVPPPENQEGGKIGWRAKTDPADHPVSQYEFDVLIGADGKRNTLEGFKRKEFRGKLAIAITANFINKRTEAEARVEEISGVAFIFNQKFFKELYSETGIDLENIVYYKDDTHYFVMTAKKHSLIDKGVILQDHADTAKLLAKENVDREALMQYAREAAEFSTEYQMMDMEFAVNHYGQPDVAMFDFTSMYAAENASRVLERHGHRLLMILVGDSLLEPFWPTGSGCARGFLSSLDACWAIKGWGAMLTPLEVIAERESIYRLLGQTTPENLNRDYAAYTLDPHTRYPNLNVRSVTPMQVRSQLDTDDPETFKLSPVQTAIDLPKKRRRRDSQVHPDTLLHWLQRQVALYEGVRIQDMGASFKSGLAIAAIIHRYRPDLIDFHALKKDEPVANNQLVFDVLEKELGIPPVMTGEEMVQCEVPDKLTMFSYLTQIYEAFRGEIPHIKHPKLEPETEDRPTLSQKLSGLSAERQAQLLGRISKQQQQQQDGTLSRTRRSRHVNENLPFVGDKKTDTMRRHARKRRSNEKMGATVDREAKIHAGHHRSSIDEGFSGRIKNIEEKLKGTSATEKKPKDLLRAIGKIEKTDWNVKEIEKKIEESKMGRAVRHDKVERVPKWSREQFLARQTKMEKKGREPSETDSKYAEIDNTLKSIDRKIKEGSLLGHNKVSAMAEQFASKNQEAAAAAAGPAGASSEPKVQRSNSKAALALPAQGGSETCHFCEKRVYLMERLTAEGKSFHRGCFRCEYCSTSLRIGNHTFDRDKNGGRFYCTQHFGLPGTMKTRIDRKKVPLASKENIPQASNNIKSPDKNKLSVEGISGLDLLDRGQTPERIEFENLAGMSDAEEAQSIMDEDEWTDRNFGPSAAEMGSSDDISDMSDSDDDNEVYEEAIDQPLTTEGTLELAKNWTLRYSHPHPAAANSDTGSNEYEDSSDDYSSTEEDSQVEMDDVMARLIRQEEVRVKVPPRISDTETGSETEVKHSQNSSTNNEQSAIINDNVTSESLPLPEIPNANGLAEPTPDLERCPITRIEITEPREEVGAAEKRRNSDERLPDAIPSYENSESSSQRSLEPASADASAIGSSSSHTSGLLPDLIAAAPSPKVSRSSSRSSLLSDQSFASLEDLSRLQDVDRLALRIPSPDTTWLEVEQVLRQSEDTDKPVVMVTAPTPTSERPSENAKPVEDSRLLMPKENSPAKRRESENQSPTSFDNLLQELRQRKARNKAEAEKRQDLKPLAVETAKLQMSRYFSFGEKERQNKNQTLEKQNSIDNEPNGPIKVVELKVKSKLSDKLEKKDILKYFAGASFESKSSTDDNVEKKNESCIDNKVEKDNAEIDILGELDDNDLQIDDIEREFDEIEKQNKMSLELLELVDIGEPLATVEIDLFDGHVIKDTKNIKECEVSNSSEDKIKLIKNEIDESESRHLSDALPQKVVANKTEFEEFVVNDVNNDFVNDNIINSKPFTGESSTEILAYNSNEKLNKDFKAQSVNITNPIPESLITLEILKDNILKPLKEQEKNNAKLLNSNSTSQSSNNNFVDESNNNDKVVSDIISKESQFTIDEISTQNNAVSKTTEFTTGEILMQSNIPSNVSELSSDYPVTQNNLQTPVPNLILKDDYNTINISSKPSKVSSEESSKQNAFKDNYYSINTSSKPPKVLSEETPKRNVINDDYNCINISLKSSNVSKEESPKQSPSLKVLNEESAKQNIINEDNNSMNTNSKPSKIISEESPKQNATNDDCNSINTSLKPLKVLNEESPKQNATNDDYNSIDTSLKSSNIPKEESPKQNTSFVSEIQDFNQNDDYKPMATINDKTIPESLNQQSYIHNETPKQSTPLAAVISSATSEVFKEMPKPPRKLITSTITTPSVEKIVIQQREILPIRISEMAKPEQPDYQSTALGPSLPAPKNTNQRRSSNEIVSMSQPTTPIAPARSNRHSELKKTFSIRLRKSPTGSESETSSRSALNTPQPAKKNGFFAGKPDDSASKAKKDKCVVS